MFDVNTLFGALGGAHWADGGNGKIRFGDQIHSKQTACEKINTLFEHHLQTWLPEAYFKHFVVKTKRLGTHFITQNCANYALKNIDGSLTTKIRGYTLDTQHFDGQAHFTESSAKHLIDSMLTGGARSALPVSQTTTSMKSATLGDFKYQAKCGFLPGDFIPCVNTPRLISASQMQ
uniref:Uncharacterized protein n=1 Tax=Caulerpa cliftonii TaxID=1004391 RepID=A0A1C9JBW6_9CHLO|nr:hypothetical protein [Caulerpa cliftonii]AOP19334.1 hypothetical protein [Caulerpa cliftonii]